MDSFKTRLPSTRLHISFKGSQTLPIKVEALFCVPLNLELSMYESKETNESDMEEGNAVANSLDPH